MSVRFAKVAFVLLLACLVTGANASDLYNEFKSAYDVRGTDLSVRPPAEVAEISNFVYEKDVARFTFASGTMYLLRHIDGRPTTAIFIGEGYADVKVPSEVERQNMLNAMRDTLVNDTFEVAFLNFADDFDLKLKEQFTFEESSFPWKDYNKSQQGEFHFSPSQHHTYDNYFELTRSLMSRGTDSYFFIDFNRFVFMYDPSLPEEVTVAYEREGGDVIVTPAVVMQRDDLGIYGDNEMSDIHYPTKILSKTGHLSVGGTRGTNIDEAAIDLQVEVLADSMRFMSTFLHYRLKIDSIYCGGQPCEYIRRNDFPFVGLILPETYFVGDTVNLTFYYHGDNYNPALPFVENPAASAHEISFTAPNGYNYIVPAQADVSEEGSKDYRFESVPSEPYRMFQFQPVVTGYDTNVVVSDLGISLSFLKGSHLNKHTEPNFIDDAYYEETVTHVFNYLCSVLGPPLATFGMYVLPDKEVRNTFPGLISVSQVMELRDGEGGLFNTAGAMTARQWFGALMQPKTDREFWLMDAVPDYLSLMCVWDGVSPGVAFGELGRRRNGLLTVQDNLADQPIAVGRRADPNLRRMKGAWIMHMLRFLMYDIETQSDQKFLQFLNELKILANYKAYTNADIIALSEKHYGGELGWFFHNWLYSTGLPEFRVRYGIDSRADGHYVTADVETRDVMADFETPVIVRVNKEDGGSTFHRVTVKAGEGTFEIGPLDYTPTDIVFNEFYSVLSNDKVKEK